MTQTTVVFGALLIAARVYGQDSPRPHWGFQGDIGGISFPKFAVEKVDALPERPSVSGKSYQVGLVRFHANGAPSYALQFSKLDADFSGASQSGSLRQAITGSGTVRGFMATKYANVVAKKHVSGGFAFGGGIGKGEASYTRQFLLNGVAYAAESNAYNRVIPLFEILARLDVRPVKFLTVGPYYGIRNGTLAAGVAVRLHITK
jgi:hypothetical protein